MSQFYHQTLLFFCLIFSFALNAQSLEGRILDENGEGLPFANIFVQEIGSGTSTDENGRYYIGLDVIGDYKLIVSSLGYETKTLDIIVKKEAESEIIDIQLAISNTELNEVIVKANRRDPAFEIIQKVIANKKNNMAAVQSFRSEVYIKAVEKIERKEKEKNEGKAGKKKEKTNEELTENELEKDPFAEAEKAKAAQAEKLNMVEVQSTLNYQYPDNYKEVRTAYKNYGTKAGLFIPDFGDTDFNFYKNSVDMAHIAETPIISPISKTAILSYKYKLLASVYEEGRMVHKIKVIPRKKGNSTVSGLIFINDGIWNINRVDFELYKSGLKVYDDFRLKQNYEKVEDSIWIPMRQEFIYETRIRDKEKFSGNTTIRYTDFENGYAFPPKFFSNEISITTEEAYERDTNYWKDIRLEPLTIDQSQMVRYRDSVSAVLNSTEYKDSIQELYNKVKPLEVFWEGVGFRNHEKEQHIFISSLPSMIDFEIVGGWRAEPRVSYWRRYKNGQVWSNDTSLSYGFRNGDVQGDTWNRFRYNAHKQADIWLGFGRDFTSINDNDAIVNQLKPSNYILSDYIHLAHQIELVNGVYFEAGVNITNRQPINTYVNEGWIDSLFTDNTPLEFEGFKSVIVNALVHYTPFQKYKTEPKRKIILGSKWPTFHLHYQKGMKGPFDSSVDFDYIKFWIDQNVSFRQFGNSRYNATVGDFINTNNLPFLDIKRFNQSNPFFFGDPRFEYQALDTALLTSNLFFEFHHIHHFNGAIINNIPLLKKTRIRTVIGGGFLWIKENNFRHEEAFVGLERVFKLGPRRRLKVGTFYVFSNSNYEAQVPSTNFKISLDLIDTWKKNWSF